MKKVIMGWLGFLLICNILNAQVVEFYPSNWFVQMKNKQVQVLIRASNENFSNATLKIQYPGVQLQKIHHFSNGHYIAADLVISETAKPGYVIFNIESEGKKLNVNWLLNARRKGLGKQYAQGLDASDLVYFLMPDRFSNGDPSNDKVAGLMDQSLNRDSIFIRHGGDLQGVTNHLNYFQQLGVTTLWMTPVVENDMPDRTEHGYATTNNYKIEKRFGGEKAYLTLSDSLHSKGMKLVQDIVYNHFGRFHFLVQDAPSQDWVHQWPTYTQTHYREQVLFDPYHTKSDEQKMINGWFTTEMPDVNHENIFVEKYLTQNAIWSVETFGIDAFRVDTYKYCNMTVMNRINKALLDEYPKIFTFGECWVDGVASQAYFVENNLNVPVKSNLTATSDFSLLFGGIIPALNETNSWNNGIIKLYSTLAQDFLYKKPSNNVIFLDNHDMTRIHSTLGESIPKTKMAYTWLYTCRGIPQLYYGSEILMKGISNPDGWVRLDFPGGWEGDTKNAFTEKGLNEKELSFLNYIKLLGNYRQKSSALKTGAFMQYLPDNGLYVYFRYDKNQTVMCVMNTDILERKVALSNFQERAAGFKGGKNIENGNTIGAEFLIPAMTMQVIELTR